MTAACDAQLVASELTEQGGEASSQLSSQPSYEAVLGRRWLSDVGAEEAGKVEQTRLRQRVEDGLERRCCTRIGYGGGHGTSGIMDTGAGRRGKGWRGGYDPSIRPSMIEAEEGPGLPWFVPGKRIIAGPWGPTINSESAHPRCPRLSTRDR